ncbi:MAG: efflux RND transporter periplasmic adaptor subunit [Ectothiorhodospiraceae bacterium]|nr:efflux RND transporter periplasmic adaptor subunit [Ectothiorhodospiraceae bacterium]MCH8504775.1 efflux RND transporter periplasmic adaptor subunit [Ectothiorhodospiraceae bacterium]
MKALRIFLVFPLSLLLLAGCGDNGDDAEVEGPDRRTLISTATVEVETVELIERTIGRISSSSAPSVNAEVTGRILEIHVEEGDNVSRGDLLLEIDPEPYELALASARTDIRRLEALIRSQERELERNRELLEEGFVTQSMFDSAEAEYENLSEQLESARVQVRNAERDLRNTSVTSPVDGAVDERMVSVGDYTQPGQTVFRLVSQDLLRVRLPFPETVSSRLEVGQAVRMRSPLSGNGEVESRISELRPALMGGSRAVEAIVNVENPGGWREGGSVNVDVVVASRENVVVPNQSVVQRPAGEVVYVIENGKAHAREVEVGIRRTSSIEILSGLEEGEEVAVDGAGFLSDGAEIRTSEE